MEGIIWVFGVLFASFGIIASYFGTVDGWKKATGDTDAHPKLAVNLEVIGSPTRSVSVSDSTAYLPSDIPASGTITFEQRDTFLYFFDFKWDYLIHLYNVSSDVALNVQLIPIVSEGIEHITDKDKTPDKPIAPYGNKDFTHYSRRTYRYNAKDADAALKISPIETVRIEYNNVGGVKCSTDYTFSTNNNVYNKEGSNKYFIVLLCFVAFTAATVAAVLLYKS